MNVYRVVTSDGMNFEVEAEKVQMNEAIGLVMFVCGGEAQACVNLRDFCFYRVLSSNLQQDEPEDE